MPVLTNPSFLQLPGGLPALFEAASSRSFFNHASWYEVLSRHATQAGTEIRLYADDLQSPSLALVMAHGSNGSQRLLSGLANYYSCECEPLWRDDGHPLDERFASLMGEIAAETPRWDEMSFAALDPSHASFEALSGALGRAGMSPRPSFDFGTWYEDTSGLSFADYLGRRPSILVNTWQRRLKKARKRIEFSLYSGPDDVERGIAQYEEIYRASWKKSEPHPDFMPELMRQCARLGALRLGVHCLDGAPGAAQMWILWHGRALIYKLAHDERFKEFSLGTLLTMQMVERVLEADRPAEINLGRGDDDYKKLWLSQRRERWQLQAANCRTPRGLVLMLKRKGGAIYRRLRGGSTREPATH